MEKPSISDKGKQTKLIAKMSKKESMELLTMRYNVTAEGLINRFGTISNAQILKATTLIKGECINVISKDDRQITAVINPIANYNKTAYVVIHERPSFKHHKHILRCNCQWCVMTNRICSHILAYMLENNIYDNYEIMGGVRV